MQITRGQFLKQLLVIPFCAKNITLEKEKGDCPVCGSNSCEIKKEPVKNSKFNNSIISNRAITSARIYIDEREIYVCKNCGSVFGKERK